jgi:hypothetical protein
VEDRPGDEERRDHEGGNANGHCGVLQDGTRLNAVNQPMADKTTMKGICLRRALPERCS